MYTTKKILEEVWAADQQIPSWFARKPLRHHDRFTSASRVFGSLQHFSEFSIIQTQAHMEKERKTKSK